MQVQMQVQMQVDSNVLRKQIDRRQRTHRPKVDGHHS
jgi:hypothetical protein